MYGYSIGQPMSGHHLVETGTSARASLGDVSFVTKFFQSFARSILVAKSARFPTGVLNRAIHRVKLVARTDVTNSVLRIIIFGTIYDEI